MRRFIAASCCAIVGLQVLIGVPVATFLVLFVCFRGNSLTPESVESRVAGDPGSLSSPIACEEPTASTAQNDSILEARAERGSLLAGTMLGGDRPAEEEQREFVAAIRQVAAEDTADFPIAAPANVLPAPDCNQSHPTAGSDAFPASADGFAVEHLYLIAEQDERAGLFERADQWRDQARAIRRSLGSSGGRGSTTCEPCSARGGSH